MAEVQDKWRKCFAEARSRMGIPCLKTEGVGDFSPTSKTPLGGSQGIACKLSLHTEFIISPRIGIIEKWLAMIRYR